jgi:RNA binding exosome subunit
VAGAVPFHYVDLRAFCYATEDERRVEDALRTLLPTEHPIDRTESEGHHGDRILVLSARVENADDVRVVLDALSDLPECRRLSDQLEDRIDENCAFYVYLDKQAASDGRVERGAGITVRAKVEAYPAKKEKAVANAREALQGIGD